ncbi:MAG: helix-turn-helix transcriptional regulator [Clostridia bacterium]|uniref:helix-turn-helix transcriptional regulator n=1 Tax=Carnobacterium sp. TaxID=48221 RepID=UPI002FC98B00
MITQIGEIIKKKRLANKLTQSELAENICTQATISNLETKDSLPTISILLKITDKLSIELDEIYEYTLGASNDYANIFKEVRELCGKSKHKDAYHLIKDNIAFDKLETIYELKQYYYYLGITSLIGYGKISDGIYNFNQSLATESGKSIDFLDVSAINGIAVAYSLSNEDDKALTYYEQSIEKLDELLTLIDTMKDSLEIAKIYYNTAKFYSKIKQYNKAVNLCSLGIQLLKNENLTYYSEFLFYEKGFNLMQLKKIEQSEKYYLYALVLADINNNQHIFDVITNDVKLYNIKNVGIDTRIQLD